MLHLYREIHVWTFLDHCVKCKYVCAREISCEYVFIENFLLSIRSLRLGAWNVWVTNNKRQFKQNSLAPLCNCTCYSYKYERIFSWSIPISTYYHRAKDSPIIKLHHIHNFQRSNKHFVTLNTAQTKEIYTISREINLYEIHFRCLRFVHCKNCV